MSFLRFEPTGIKKRAVMFAGHYGSGKTGLAAAFALSLAAAGERVSVLDLDIINPYFRTSDRRGDFDAAGVRLISPTYAGTNVEAPAIPPAAMSLLSGEEGRFVIDLGGDDAGATAFGRFASALPERELEALFVVNMYRPVIREPGDAAAIMREIEEAGRFRFSAIVNNSNLSRETEGETVRESYGYASEVSALTGLPILFTSAEERVARQLDDCPTPVYGMDVCHRVEWGL